jgi:hypothetical protein
LRVDKIALVWISSLLEHEFETSDSCSSGTINHYPHILDLLFLDFKGIDEASKAHDGSAVLVVVEHRDVHVLFKFFFNIEAVWTFDIFKVNTGEAG